MSFGSRRREGRPARNFPACALGIHKSEGYLIREQTKTRPVDTYMRVWVRGNKESQF